MGSGQGFLWSNVAITIIKEGQPQLSDYYALLHCAKTENIRLPSQNTFSASKSCPECVIIIIVFHRHDLTTTVYGNFCKLRSGGISKSVFIQSLRLKVVQLGIAKLSQAKPSQAPAPAQLAGFS